MRFFERGGPDKRAGLTVQRVLEKHYWPDDLAPVKKLMMVDGGANPTGDPCRGQHYHGFIGMEKEAIDSISAWIRSPAN